MCSSDLGLSGYIGQEPADSGPVELEEFVGGSEPPAGTVAAEEWARRENILLGRWVSGCDEPCLGLIEEILEEAGSEKDQTFTLWLATFLEQSLTILSVSLHVSPR